MRTNFQKCVLGLLFTAAVVVVSPPTFSQEAGIVKRPIPRQYLNHNSATAFSFRLPLVPFAPVPFFSIYLYHGNTQE